MLLGYFEAAAAFPPAPSFPNFVRGNRAKNARNDTERFVSVLFDFAFPAPSTMDNC
jgi:hypothetical protein